MDYELNKKNKNKNNMQSNLNPFGECDYQYLSAQEDLEPSM